MEVGVTGHLPLMPSLPTPLLVPVSVLAALKPGGVNADNRAVCLYMQVKQQGTVFGVVLRCPECCKKMSLAKDSMFPGLKMEATKLLGLVLYTSSICLT